LEKRINRFKFYSTPEANVWEMNNKTDAMIVPGFVTDITIEMLAQIDGITDLIGMGGGFLILFNINGIPMFCTTEVLNSQKRYYYYYIIDFIN